MGRCTWRESFSPKTIRNSNYFIAYLLFMLISILKFLLRQAMPVDIRWHHPVGERPKPSNSSHKTGYAATVHENSFFPWDISPSLQKQADTNTCQGRRMQSAPNFHQILVSVLHACYLWKAPPGAAASNTKIIRIGLEKLPRKAQLSCTPGFAFWNIRRLFCIACYRCFPCFFFLGPLGLEVGRLITPFRKCVSSNFPK